MGVIKGDTKKTVPSKRAYTGFNVILGQGIVASQERKIPRFMQPFYPKSS